MVCGGEVLHPGLAFVPSDPGWEKQETHILGNNEESKEKPLWNSGARQWPVRCLGVASLGQTWVLAKVCEEAERGRAGSRQILRKGDSWGLSQERALDRKGNSQQGTLGRNFLRL